MSGAQPIFDRRIRRKRRSLRAAGFADHDFLHRRAMLDVVDRLETTTRDFPRAAFFGCGDLVSLLTPRCGVGWFASFDDAIERLPAGGARSAMDDEAPALAPESLDLVVNLLSLHAANDIVGALVQARAALRPDGLFIGVMFGGETLQGAKSAFYEAEAAASGGASLRFAPMAHLKDLGAALQRAGFALPVADVDTVRVRYSSARRMIEDLRGMGETNSLAGRPRHLGRAAAAAGLARIVAQGEARFDLVTLTGWAPAASQPKPLRPGSARTSLAAAVTASTPPPDPEQT